VLLGVGLSRGGGAEEDEEEEVVEVALRRTRRTRRTRRWWRWRKRKTVHALGAIPNEVGGGEESHFIILKVSPTRRVPSLETWDAYNSFTSRTDNP
jgi:hypothetical protein